VFFRSNTNVPLGDLNEDEEHSTADAAQLQEGNALKDTGEGSGEDSFDYSSERIEVESTPTTKERRHRQPRGYDKILGFLKEKEAKKHNKPQPDELDHFFASAAQSVRKLPRLAQIKLRRDITNLICEAEEQQEIESSLGDASFLMVN
jgi:hypothetical protein